MGAHGTNVTDGFAITKDRALQYSSKSNHEKLTLMPTPLYWLRDTRTRQLWTWKNNTIMCIPLKQLKAHPWRKQAALKGRVRGIHNFRGVMCINATLVRAVYSLSDYPPTSLSHVIIPFSIVQLLQCMTTCSNCSRMAQTTVRGSRPYPDPWSRSVPSIALSHVNLIRNYYY